MTMTVHRQHADFTSDLETTRSRVHEAGIQAENFLHHLGAISIINSDSLGMGRMGETVRRTFQLAGHPALRSEAGLDNETVLQFLAKITINPAIAHGIAADVGSLLPGRLADVVLWKPAWFGAKPEFVIKSGFVAWGATGQGNGSTRLSQPRLMGPFFGGLGSAPRRLAATFVAGSALGGKDLVSGPMYLPVRGAKNLSRADMVRNHVVPSVEVPADGSPVQVNGRGITLAPLDHVPVGQSAFLA
jgi:urease subunit alpha